MYGLNPLRRARQLRGLTLDDVAKLTKLSPRVLHKIEMGEFDSLPAGLQGRAHVRAYARAVGLDTEEVLRALADRLPTEPEPLGALRARVRQRFAEDHPVAAALGDRLTLWRDRAITLARAAPLWPTRASYPWRYLVAASIDGAILALVGAVTLVASAWITGTGVTGVWNAARWPLAVSYGLTTILYFTVSTSVGQRTPGAVVAASLVHAIQQRFTGPGVPRWRVSN